MFVIPDGAFIFGWGWDMEIYLRMDDLMFASRVKGGKNSMVGDGTGIACNDQINASGRSVRRHVCGFV